MNPEVSIRWGNPPVGIQNAPLYLGIRSGLFADCGAGVELRDSQSGADSRDAIVAGAYDMGHGGAPNVFAALARTNDYAVVGLGLLKHPPFCLIASPAVGRIGGLIGRVVTINKRRTCSHTILRTLLHGEGLDEDHVHLTTRGEGWAIVDAIRRGETSAAILWEPYTSHVERVFGWSVIAEGRTVIVPSNYCMVIYARRTVLDEAPSLVARLLGTYEESVRAAQQDPEAATAVVRARMPEMPTEDIESGLRREAAYWSPDTRLDYELLERVELELRRQAGIPVEFDPARVMVEVARHRSADQQRAEA